MSLEKVAAMVGARSGQYGKTSTNGLTLSSSGYSLTAAVAIAMYAMNSLNNVSKYALVVNWASASS